MLDQRNEYTFMTSYPFYHSCWSWIVSSLLTGIPPYILSLFKLHAISFYYNMFKNAREKKPTQFSNHLWRTYRSTYIHNLQRFDGVQRFELKAGFPWEIIKIRINFVPFWDLYPKDWFPLKKKREKSRETNRILFLVGSYYKKTQRKQEIIMARVGAIYMSFMDLQRHTKDSPVRI